MNTFILVCVVLMFSLQIIIIVSLEIEHRKMDVISSKLDDITTQLIHNSNMERNDTMINSKRTMWDK